MFDRDTSQIEGVRFKIFTSDEIEKLSVLEIKNPVSFDSLGHPVPGGFYDAALGPAKRNDLCSTCGLDDNECPGHFGHIKLCVPIYNPFLFRQLFNLLQMVCTECYHLRVNPVAVIIALYQFEALDRGLGHLVEELPNRAMQILEEIQGDSKSESICEMLRLELDRVLTEEEPESKANTSDCQIKHIVDLRQRLFSQLMSGKLIKGLKSCPSCSAKKVGMKLLNNNSIVLSLARGSKKPLDFSEEAEPDPITESQTLLDKTFLTPDRAKEIMRNVWTNESETLRKLFALIDLTSDTQYPTDIFFIQVLAVPPNRFRPLRHLNGKTFENENTSALTVVLRQNLLLESILSEVAKYRELLKQNPTVEAKRQESMALKKLLPTWQRLQMVCNRIYDSDMDRVPEQKYPGVRQLLEKKEGLFRKHMMGKRVNFAARSVISPDPYIMMDEIGIPLVFALRLTYPTPVTPWNVRELREAVMNGPEVHPGAVAVHFEDGQCIRLRADNPNHRKAVANRLTCGSLGRPGVKIVDRHLKNGDMLLINRQPTLHKPSIMAHRARIMYGERTLRLHFGVCKSFNADFDGDEMNAHLPQNELGRSEAHNIASVRHQFLVPKDGTPLSGLIQDHIIAGALITQRDNFLTRLDYQGVVYSALSFLETPIKLLPPVIRKPQMLWTGKQVISTIIINCLPEGKVPPNVIGPSKVSAKILGTKMTDLCDSQVIIRGGELLTGFLDKTSIGPTPYGLVHLCYELYGGQTSTALLSAFGRLGTHYLQTIYGFTLGISDILVTDEANENRTKLIKESLTVGDEVVAKCFGVSNTDPDILLDKYRDAHAKRTDFHLKQLDMAMKGTTDQIANQISSGCLPDGLVKLFPSNNLQLMIQAGAKGGTVNALQISCLLGQIELEGRRVPLMMSGRSLPSFKPYDTSPRAGGFVSDRFMTGIRPQEFFFHCMAGREGLIDTAVKTSRSGYLQRCLIKHLEGLLVNYDMTVRDSDGSVVQFQYGEDGLDILKCQMLKEKQFPALVRNAQVLSPSPEELKAIKEKTDSKGIKKLRKKIEEWDQMVIDLPPMLRSREPRPGPVSNVFAPHSNLGSISEKMEQMMKNYLKKNVHDLNKECLTKDDMRNLIRYRYMRSLADPGEAVGLLAAQSIGEPSTQMTLNTFHFAGRGEMNVTLGIPRLREILMTASPNIATPSMDVPFRTDLPENFNIEKRAHKINIRLNSVKLTDVLENVSVNETIRIMFGTCYRIYEIKFNFLPYKLYRRTYYVKPDGIMKFMENRFIKQLLGSILKKIKDSEKTNALFVHSGRTTRKRTQPGKEEDEEGEPTDAKPEMPQSQTEGDEESSGDEEIIEGDSTAVRTQSRRNQELEYEEPEEEETAQYKNEDTGSGEGYDEDDRSSRKTYDERDEEQVDEEDQAEYNRVAEEFGLDHSLFEESNMSMLSKMSVKRTERIMELQAAKEGRIKEVCLQSPLIEAYDFDIENEEWCSVTLKFEAITSKLDVNSIIEDEARRAYIHKVGRIERAFLVDDMEARSRGARFDKMIKTEGVSFLSLIRYEDVLDISRVYSNDIHAIANTFGIEAAARTIRREMKNVFAVYGIEVDERHLSLVADYMTQDGSVKGMNRGSMAANASPFQQMTFETTANFLRTATLIGSKDEINSPSACIVVGRPAKCGTGSFELLQPQIEEHVAKARQNPLVSMPKVSTIFKSKSKSRGGKRPRDSEGRRSNVEKSVQLNKRIKFE